MPRVFDYALDCNDCGRTYVYGTREERDAEEPKHLGHEFELFRQARV